MGDNISNLMIWIFMDACLHVCICVGVNVYVLICRPVSIRTCECVRVCVYVCSVLYAYKSVYILSYLTLSYLIFEKQSD